MNNEELGKARVRVNLPDKQLRTFHDHYQPHKIETQWRPLLDRSVYDGFFRDERMGIHNVRHANTGTRVMDDVRSCLINTPELFGNQHRGFTYAGSMRRASDKEVVFEFDFDNGKVGCIDGNTSRLTIVELVEGDFQLLDRIESGELSAPQLNITILTGLTPDEMIEVGISRNEQINVTESTAANHRGEYEIIKESLPEAIRQRIAFKQNDPRGLYSVESVLQDIVAMDSVKWPNSEENPIMSYVSRIRPRNHFRENHEQMERLAPLYLDILRFHEIVQRDFVDAYVKNRVRLVTSFYDMTGIAREEGTFHFINDPRSYRIPRSLSMPILGAFRQLVDLDNGKAQWTVGSYSKLVQTWERMAPALTKRVLEYVKDEGNANKAAKKSTLWISLYEDVQRRLRTAAA